MNCILQTIVHNPLMRAHYLADLHSPRTCATPPEAPCLACELTTLVGEVCIVPGCAECGKGSGGVERESGPRPCGARIRAPA